LFNSQLPLVLRLVKRNRVYPYHAPRNVFPLVSACLRQRPSYTIAAGHPTGGLWVQSLNGQRLRAVYRVGFGLLTLAALSVQFLTGWARPPFSAVNFFSYFTTLTNLLGASVFLWVGLGARRTLGVELVRGAVTLYLSLVFVVYALLQSDIPLGILRPWVNTVLHQMMPLAALLDWVCAPPKHRLGLCSDTRLACITACVRCVQPDLQCKHRLVSISVSRSQQSRRVHGRSGMLRRYHGRVRAVRHFPYLDRQLFARKADRQLSRALATADRNRNKRRLPWCQIGAWSACAVARERDATRHRAYGLTIRERSAFAPPASGCCGREESAASWVLAWLICARDKWWATDLSGAAADLSPAAMAREYHK
jgi:hypothetical protein